MCIQSKQECIPIGCVPPTAVAITGGLYSPWEQAPPRSRHPPGSRHPQEQTPVPWPDPINFPLGCGPGLDPPQFPPWLWAWTRSPSTFPLGVGPEAPLQSDPPKLPPWVWAWKPARHAGIPPPDLLQGMLGYHLQCMLG